MAVSTRVVPAALSAAVRVVSSPYLAVQRCTTCRSSESVSACLQVYAGDATPRFAAIAPRCWPIAAVDAIDRLRPFDCR